MTWTLWQSVLLCCTQLKKKHTLPTLLNTQLPGKHMDKIIVSHCWHFCKKPPGMIDWGWKKVQKEGIYNTKNYSQQYTLIGLPLSWQSKSIFNWCFPDPHFISASGFVKCLYRTENNQTGYSQLMLTHLYTDWCFCPRWPLLTQSYRICKKTTMKHSD